MNNYSGRKDRECSIQELNLSLPAQFKKFIVQALLRKHWTKALFDNFLVNTENRVFPRL